MLKHSIPFLFALLVLSCSGNPQFSIDTEVYDAGDMAPHERRTRWFNISNTGDAELIIENVRPLCDCITIDSIPGVVPPGGSDSFLVTYISPDSAGPDESSFIIRTNTEPKNTKILIRSNVLEVKLTPADSTICIIPFQATGMPDANAFILDLFNYLVTNLPEGHPAVSPNELSQRIKNDANYGKEAIHIVVRKWANLLGIRYTVMGEVTPSSSGSGVDIGLMIVDGSFHLPVGLRINSVPSESVGTVISDTLAGILANIVEYEKQALFMDYQRKWKEQRAKIVGKPAPPIEAEDIHTGEMVSLKDFRGKPLIIQFLSTDCHSCEKETEWLSDLVKRHPEIAAIGISVNIGENDSVKAFLEGKELPYPIILPNEDNEEQLDPYYGGATPQTVILSPDGMVVESYMGFNERSLKVFEQMLIELARTGDTSGKTTSGN